MVEDIVDQNHSWRIGYIQAWALPVSRHSHV